MSELTHDEAKLNEARDIIEAFVWQFGYMVAAKDKL